MSAYGQTKAVIGKGTTIGYGADGTSAPGSFTTVFSEVKKTNMPKIKTSQAKATHFQSPNNFHEYVIGWNDAGDVQFEANYLPTDRATLLGMLNQYHWFQITYPPDGSNATHTDTFRGFITEIDGDVPNEEVITAKVTIKVTGATTFA